MKPVLLAIPALGLSVYGSGLMIALGFVAGLFVAARRARRSGLGAELVHDLAPWMLVGGLVGARLFYVAEFWGETVGTVGEVFRIADGGLVLHGAAVGAAVAFLARRAWRPFPALATLDALAPGLAIGVAVGRVGCLLNGCCYGGVCPWPAMGVRFPPGCPAWLAERARGLIPADAATTLALVPTQALMVAEGLFLYGLLALDLPGRRREGAVFGRLLWAYPFTHFFLESLRDDEVPVFRGLSPNQVGCLFLLAAASLYATYLNQQAAGPAKWVRPPGR